MKFEEQKKIELLRYLYNLEYESHERNFIEAEECLKQNVGTNQYAKQFLMLNILDCWTSFPQKKGDKTYNDH